MMFKNSVQEHYPWAKIQSRLDELIYELSRAEDEEEAELALLRMHAGNDKDLRLFNERERKTIRRYVAILIRDTEKHCKLLAEAVGELEGRKKVYGS